MESPLLTLLVLCLGVVLSFFALSVVSQGNENPERGPPAPPTPSAQDPHSSSPFPPPHLSPPLTPPLSPPTLSPPPATPAPPLVPPPPFSPPRRPPPPSTRRYRGSPLPENSTRSPPQLPKRHNNTSQDHSRRENMNSTSGQKLNIGKKIGLMFVGVAAILQICVVAFLGIKRRQLLKANQRR